MKNSKFLLVLVAISMLVGQYLLFDHIGIMAMSSRLSVILAVIEFIANQTINFISAKGDAK